MIRVLFFGRVADRMGRRELVLDDEQVVALKGLYALRTYLFAEASDGIMMSVNQQVEREDALLQNGDEVAFFSPFSGG